MAFPFTSSRRATEQPAGIAARLQLPLLLLCSAVAMAANGDKSPQELLADNYVFDSSLFRGGPLSQATLSRFNRINAVAPGNYKVDLFINNRFVDRTDVRFVSVADGQVQPCLTPAQLQSAGVEADSIAGETAPPEGDAACRPLDQLLKGSSSQLDMARLRLDLSVPQSLMKRVPRGYVNPADLDAGSAIGFVNYIGNYYHVSYTGDYAGSQDSAYLSLNGGVNLGMWQYRQQSNLTYDRDFGTHWSNIRSYVQRPLPSMDSQLSLGQTYTTGRFFSGLAYTGLNLSSDERMLPDSMRGYAPTVRGVARTNARVSIRQNGQEIYQTTVAPGPFEISDLYPTSYNGDLEVEVTEADGSTSRFSVPFSAVPESLRPGISRYGLALGRTRDIGDDSLFGDLTYQRGLSNTITANSGMRVADGYQALMLGGVYASSLGAFGLDLTYSRADLPDIGYLDGWMAHLSYSRTFQPTSTTLSIAGYRYSTSGYRDLGDVLGVREAARDGYTWQSTTYQQQSRIEVSVNQSLGRYGNLFLSGSTQNYRDGRDRDTQLQLGYGNAFSNGVSVNLSVARQRIGGYDSRVPGGYDQNDPSYPGFGYNGSISGDVDTITTLSVSLPLGSQANTRTPTLSNSYSHSTSGGSQYQSTVSGMADQDQTLSYSLGVTRDQEMRQTVWNGNLQKRLPSTSLGLSTSRGDDYWQAAGNAQGALAIHSGGVTFGPYLGDTFALVEAKGATGAKVLNAQGTTIDGNGYALVPAVTPYRYNSVALDPQGMQGKAELEDGEQRVAPYAGAAVKVRFKTRTGNALLIRTRLANGQAVPPGAEAYDESGSVIGMVGQGSQVYVRSDKPRGRLSLRWGEDSDERCSLPYDTTGKDLEQVLIRLEATCTPE